MNRPSFPEGVALCLQRDPRYTKEAYGFIRDALEHTQKKIAAERKLKGAFHVNGPEILAGFREHALEQFGPLARLVLETWGIRETLDVGNIVFNLINAEVFSQSDTDQVSDFAGLYTFEDAFDAPFRPDASAPKAARE